MQQVVAQVARASEHARPQGQAVFLETGHPPCLQRAVGEHGDLRGSQRQHDVQAARGDGHGNRRAGAVLCLGVYPDPVQPASLADEFLVDGPRHPHSPVPVGIQAGGGVLGRVDQHRPSAARASCVSRSSRRTASASRRSLPRRRSQARMRFRAGYSRYQARSGHGDRPPPHRRASRRYSCTDSPR